MENNFDLKKIKNIYMIGIGGISMSGIADLLNYWKYNVSGSDSVIGDTSRNLQKKGITVYEGHSASNLDNPDLVIYTAAIKDDNPELSFARENNIPTIERGEFLGELSKMYSETIAIAGTHGKTTTTSMTSLCFLEAGMDPTILVGGILKPYETNYIIGNSDYFIIEACEYVDSFLSLYPKTEIILNIEADHLDYFKDLNQIKESFKKYINRLPEDGLLIVNADDKNCMDVCSEAITKLVTFGVENKADYTAKNISFNDEGCASFDVYYNEELLVSIEMIVPGMHNVLNALACIATSSEYKISAENIKNALKKFSGVHRRFDYVGEYNGAQIYNDYAHHPTELEAVLNIAQNRKHNKSWVIFQPHTYSRTYQLLDDFAKVLHKFDNIIVTDIYAAREVNTFNISSEDLVNKIKENNDNAYYIKDLEEVKSKIRENVEKDDIVLVLGAGDIINICEDLVA